MLLASKVSYSGLCVPNEQRLKDIRRAETAEENSREVIRKNCENEGVSYEKAISASDESTRVSGKVGVNVGKTARKIAAAKTKSQLQAVIAEIRGDIQVVKAGMKKGWCDQSEMDKVNALMSMAQNRMGQVEDREPTPEEKNAFAMASLL